jgi:ketosteroid isomerase-like protein
LRTAKQRKRALDERLALRFPSLTAALARLVAMLPPSARLRRASLARLAWLSLEAYNRRDLAAVAASWDPGFEYRPERQWVAAGLADESYVGLDRYKRYVATADQVWGGENYLTPRELIDLGDRVLVLADGDMRGQASGVALSQEYAALAMLAAGRPVRIQEYYNHDEALSLVGLSRR